MARRTIVTCDLCKEEITNPERLITLSAALLTQAGGIAAKFEHAEFCSQGCALAAMRALLNGAA